MKFKGKIDLWFWIVMLLGEALFISMFLAGEGIGLISIFSAIIYNLCFLPFVFRNYVEISEEKLTVAFGFGKESIALSEIIDVYRTNNLLASSAASVDRIVIKGYQKEIMCSVKEREKFFAYLQEKRPDIELNDNKKDVRNTSVAKFSIIFCVATFVIVGVLLITGDIKMVYGEESFTIKASYWYDEEIAYEEIESIEYVDGNIRGSRSGGFESFRLQMGTFESKEYGYYTRYTYINCDAGVVLLVNGKEVVLSGKDKESTKDIYEELFRRCQLQ